MYVPLVHIVKSDVVSGCGVPTVKNFSPKFFLLI